MSTLAVPVSTSLIREVILRSEGRIDPTKLIEDVLADYLNRTLGDAEIWSEQHKKQVAERSGSIGKPNKGYFWSNVFLPNGTKLMFTYKSQQNFAEVANQHIFYKDKLVEHPSQFVKKVAGGTSRNAWKDIWILRPTDQEWILADTLRHLVA